MTCRPGHPPRHPDFEPDNTHTLTVPPARRRRVAGVRSPRSSPRKRSRRSAVASPARLQVVGGSVGDRRTRRAARRPFGSTNRQRRRSPAISMPRTTVGARLSIEIPLASESLRARLRLRSQTAYRRGYSLPSAAATFPVAMTCSPAFRAEGARLVAAHDAGPALPPVTANDAHHNVRGAEIDAQAPESIVSVTALDTLAGLVLGAADDGAGRAHPFQWADIHTLVDTAPGCRGCTTGSERGACPRRATLPARTGATPDRSTRTVGSFASRGGQRSGRLLVLDSVAGYVERTGLRVSCRRRCTRS